jgi:hypothetical protein
LPPMWPLHSARGDQRAQQPFLPALSTPPEVRLFVPFRTRTET